MKKRAAERGGLARQKAEPMRAPPLFLPVGLSCSAAGGPPHPLRLPALLSAPQIEHDGYGDAGRARREHDDVEHDQPDLPGRRAGVLIDGAAARRQT